MILLLVYVDSSNAAISKAAPSPMIPHAAIRNMTARFTLPSLLLVSFGSGPPDRPELGPAKQNSFDPNSNI